MMDIISDLNQIINNVMEYIGICKIASSDYDSVLTAAVEKHSVNLYKDYDKLKNAMREFGATESQIIKIYMMTLVDGFREILEIDERVQQIDINRYVQNAIRQTGFNVAQIFELTSAIIGSLGIECLTNSSKVLSRGNETTGYVVPMSVYENELKLVEQKLNHGRIDRLRESEIARLEVLAKAGIPRAKYYLGSYLLKKEEFEKNAPLGLQYLEEAAADGDSLAAGALGDIYYELADSDSWSKAYSYYTRNGSLALNIDRKKRIVEILNYRKFNVATIIASIVIALGMLSVVIIAPANAHYASYRMLGCILFSVSIALIVLSIIHHRQKPYDNLSWLPCSVFVIWTLHFLIRIIF